MQTKYYKIIIAGLVISLIFSTFMAYQFNKIDILGLDYIEAKELAYQQQICNLQEQLDYQVCQVAGKLVEFNKNKSD